MNSIVSIAGVREQRAGDDDQRRRQLRRAGPHLRDAPSRHGPRQDGHEALGHRPRLLPAHPDGLDDPQAQDVRGVLVAGLDPREPGQVGAAHGGGRPRARHLRGPRDDRAPGRARRRLLHHRRGHGARHAEPQRGRGAQRGGAPGAQRLLWRDRASAGQAARRHCRRQRAAQVRQARPSQVTLFL